MTSLSDSEEYRSQFLLPPNQKSMQEYKSIAFINSKEGSDLRIPEKATLGKVINHSTLNLQILETGRGGKRTHTVWRTGRSPLNRHAALPLCRNL